MANTSNKPLAAIVLAAGKGTRMESDLPKVVHEIGGRPMVCAVVDACLEAGCERVVAVVGYKQELVREALAEYGDKVAFAEQPEQLGTGHAVLCAKDAVADLTEAGADLFVLCGDGPLIRSGTLDQIIDLHRSNGAAATLATSRIADPTGYGRIVRNTEGGFVAIVEQKNLAEDQLGINEVNPSYYCFDARGLFEALDEVERNPVTGEYYVTDAPAILMDKGRTVEVIDAVPPEDILSINTTAQLAEVDRLFRARHQNA